MSVIDKSRLLLFVGGTVPVEGASAGDVAALAGEVAGKADIANSGKVFTNRAAAVSAGQTNLPGALGLIFTVEGANNETLAVRSFSNASDDPLFETAPRWGVAMRVPNQFLLDQKLQSEIFDLFFPERVVENRMIPLDMDAQERVALWLNNGNLDARGMAKGLRDKATADIAPKMRVGKLIPLDLVGGRVATWLHPTKGFQAAGLKKSLTSADLAASEARAADLYAPRIQPHGATVPIATDGRSLHRIMGKIAQIKAGVSGATARIAMTGDSWSELVNIPNAVIDLLTDRLAPAAGSYIQANSQYLWTGVTVSASAGWTRQDASVNSDWPYGTGPDGQVYHTATDADALTINGITGTSLRIYTRKWGATWTYALNGDSPVTVTESATDGSLTVTEVTGLTAGANSLVITKSGAPGMVVYCGLRNVRESNIEVLKVGNGGLTGYRMRDYAPLVSDIWTDLAPDLALVNLGTNDYRNSITPPSTYLDGITAATNMLRAAVPDVGIIVLMPPQTDGVAINPLTAYRDVLYQHCLATGVEMLNLLDCWGPYNPALMADSLHVNTSGAALIAHQLNQHFMGV